ncbi:hypothetical protein KP509_16G035500 [Ceratopteris richardii]|uniref:Secreted protein n=1 Tax=Ceratopteris richardii TaxID=49495 RepID=A0A8T2T1G8_CERRI|nr:hypothetical protein KP509_16G035500 [Ceratopteris richardii]
MMRITSWEARLFIASAIHLFLFCCIVHEVTGLPDFTILSSKEEPSISWCRALQKCTLPYPMIIRNYLSFCTVLSWWTDIVVPNQI